MCVRVCMQGQSRRIQVEVRPVPDSGTMPLMAECVLGVQVGNVEVQLNSRVSSCHVTHIYTHIYVYTHKAAVSH